MAKRPTIDSIDVSLVRWKTRLKRAVTTIDKLEKQKKRLLKPRAHKPSTTLVESVESALRECITTDKPVAPEVLDDIMSKAFDEKVSKAKAASETVNHLDIPGFLRRQPEPSPAADQIREEQAKTKKSKARGRIEKMKAKQRGDLKKMPLTGKAALDAIRNG